MTLGPNLGGVPLGADPSYVGVVKSERPRLTNGEIIFEEFQPMWSQFTNITDGQTDRRHAIVIPRFALKCIGSKRIIIWYYLGIISFARVNSATLFSAKVSHLIKCAFYTNTPLKRPKQETIRIFVSDCMPCRNFTVNIGLLAAHEDRNTVKLQSRFSPIRLWPRWTTFVPNGCNGKG